MTSSSVEHPMPSPLSTHERHATPVAAGAPPMTEDTLHRMEGHDAFSDRRPIPHRSAPNFQPDLMAGAAAGHGPHHTGQRPIPLSSRSRSNNTTTGWDGLAAKHHHDTHDHNDSVHGANENPQGTSRKLIGGALGSGATRHSSNRNITHDASPEYQAGHSGSYHDNMMNPSEPFGMAGNNNTTVSAPMGGSPPAYNGGSHPLTSHPPSADNHRHTIGHGPLMTAASVLGGGAGAAGGTSTGRNHDEDRIPDSSLTGRRSWDPNRQSRNPQSILTNTSNRRSTGSTNPYVQPRSPLRARLSDDAVHKDNQAEAGNNRRDEPLSRGSPYPRMESPQLVRPDSYERRRNGSPQQMPGGWRGSRELDRTAHRSSLSNHIPNINTTITTTTAASGQASNPNTATPSLKELRQQEEEGWYRGRYMGDDVRPADSGRTMGHDQQRFYSGKGVGQAI